jgi:inorganic pyrophosphatase
MAKKKRRSPGLADPVRLAPRDAEEPALVVVIIETPKGSRNKYAYDPKERIFELKKVLPAGMAFPYDFGFVPSTIGGDGGKIERNDRVVAIENANHSFARIKKIDDLGKTFCAELEEFFVNYHELDGQKYRIRAVKGPKAAQRAIKGARVR